MLSYFYIYRYKKCITNIKILTILITITTTAIMLVINNNNDINYITITKKRNKESSDDFHTYSLAEYLTRV